MEKGQICFLHELKYLFFPALRHLCFWPLDVDEDWCQRPPGALGPPDPDWIIPPADSRSWDFQFSITTWTSFYNCSPLTYLSLSILVSLVSLENPGYYICLSLKKDQVGPGCSDVFPESPYLPDGRTPGKHCLQASQCTMGKKNQNSAWGRYLHVSFLLKRHLQMTVCLYH